MITAAQLIGLVTVSGVEESIAKLQGMGAATDSVGAKLGLLAAGAVVIAGAALVALGGKVATMAGDFQQGVVRLKTGAGDAQDSFAQLGSHIQQIAVSTATATKPLIDAMYQILSTGQRGAEAYNTLAVAAMGARIEQANIVDVANTLTTAMSDYGVKQFNATQFMNGYIAAVQRGKITLQDLSNAMGPIIPQAKDMGISFADLSAAMSTQTDAGINAARAATGLRFLMQSLENPTKKATTAMQDMGLNTVAVAKEMAVSLPGALQMIYKAALKAGPEGSVPFNRAISDMIGGQRSLSAFMALTGTHMKDFVSNSGAITSAMKKGGSAVQGWSDIQGEFNFKMGQVGEVLETMGQKLGTLLLPILGKLADWFTTTGAPALQRFGTWIMTVGIPALRAFGDWIQSHVLTAVQALSTFFQGHILPVLQAIGSFLATTFAPLWTQLVAVWQSSLLPSLKQLWGALQPLLPVLAAIGGIILGAVIVAIGIFVGVIGGLLKALSGLLQGVATVIGGMVQFFTGGVQIISGIINFFKDLVTGNFKNLGNDLHSIWNGIVNMFIGVWNVIKGIFQGAWNAISGFVSGLVTGVIGFFSHLKDMLVGHSIVPDIVNGILQWFGQLPGKLFSLAVQMVQGLINGIGSMAGNFASALGSLVHNAVGNIPGLGGILSNLHILGYQEGGPVMQTGLALVHQGEYVIPAGGWSGYSVSSSSGASGGTPIILQVDGYQFARLLMPHIVTAIRNGVGVRNL